MVPAYLIKLSGIMQKPAEKRKLKPGNHATVTAQMVLKTVIEMVPVTTSKQAMQANKAPAKKEKEKLDYRDPDNCVYNYTTLHYTKDDNGIKLIQLSAHTIQGISLTVRQMSEPHKLEPKNQTR